MKRLALLAPLALASCGVLGTPQNYDVNGTISGTAPAGTVKMAVVGVALNGVVNADVPQIALTVFDQQKFSVDYPANPADGIYQVIAYVDKDGNGQYTLGEPRTQNNGKYLVYTKSGLLPSITGLSAGWNYVVGTRSTQPNRIHDYDLSW